MKTPERLRVLGRRKHSTNRFEVGPHGDCKAFTPEDAWLDPRLESSNRAVVLREPFHNFNFRRQPRLIRLPAEPTRPRSRERQRRWRRDPRNDIAWRQADDKGLESLRTTASSTAKSSAEAVDLAAATARRASAGCIPLSPG